MITHRLSSMNLRTGNPAITQILHAFLNTTPFQPKALPPTLLLQPLTQKHAQSALSLASSIFVQE
jgi:hypothetical protein